MRIRRVLALALAVLLALGTIGAMAAADTTKKTIPITKKYFPDKLFRYLVKAEFDSNGDGKLSSAERNKVKTVFTGGMSGFKSLKGIEYFPNLKSIDCTDNSLTSIDLSGNPALESFTCCDTGIKELDLRKNTKLKKLDITRSSIRKLDLRKNVNLKSLDAHESSLASVKLNKCVKLTTLILCDTRIKKLDVTKNTELSTLDCTMCTRLTELDVSKNAKLKYLGCSATGLTKLTLCKNPKSRLYVLSCSDTNIKKLDLAKYPKLAGLVKSTQGRAMYGECTWEKGRYALTVPYDAKVYSGKKLLYKPGDVPIEEEEEEYY